MALISGGVRVAGFMSPTDSTDKYPTHKAVYGHGGLRTVANLTARDNIEPERREEGMLAYVITTQKLYQLQGGIGNGDWVELIINTPKNNYSATADPTPANNASQGYSVGSNWIYPDSRREFVLVFLHPTTGDALWFLTTPSIGSIVVIKALTGEVYQYGTLDAAIAAVGGSDTIYVGTRYIWLTSSITIPNSVNLVGLSARTFLFFNTPSLPDPPPVEPYITLQGNNLFANFNIILLPPLTGRCILVDRSCRLMGIDAGSQGAFPCVDFQNNSAFPGAYCFIQNSRLYSPSDFCFVGDTGTQVGSQVRFQQTQLRGHSGIKAIGKVDLLIDDVVDEGLTTKFLELGEADAYVDGGRVEDLHTVFHLTHDLSDLKVTGFQAKNTTTYELLIDPGKASRAHILSTFMDTLKMSFPVTATVAFVGASLAAALEINSSALMPLLFLAKVNGIPLVTIDKLGQITDVYIPPVSANWVGPAPTTTKQAIDRMSAYLAASHGPIP